MQLDPRQVSPGTPCSASQVGWFAARQPGIVRFLEERLMASDGDAFAVGLEGAWHMCRAFETRDRLPPPRTTRSLLERAEAAVTTESRHPGAFPDGLARRQPAVCSWLLELVDAPPVPLTPDESRAVGLALAAVLYALDELTTGRQVP